MKEGEKNKSNLLSETLFDFEHNFSVVMHILY